MWVASWLCLGGNLVMSWWCLRGTLMTACWCHSLHFSRFYSLDQGYTAAWSHLECIWEIESGGWGWGICQDFTFWIVFEVWQDGVHESNRADAEKRCHTLWRMRGHGFTMIYMCMVVECGHCFTLPYHIHFSIKTSLYQPHRSNLSRSNQSMSGLGSVKIDTTFYNCNTRENFVFEFFTANLLSIKSMSIKFVFPIYCLSNFSLSMLSLSSGFVSNSSLSDLPAWQV